MESVLDPVCPKKEMEKSRPALQRRCAACIGMAIRSARGCNELTCTCGSADGAKAEATAAQASATARGRSILPLPRRRKGVASGRPLQLKMKFWKFVAQEVT